MLKKTESKNRIELIAKLPEVRRFKPARRCANTAEPPFKGDRLLSVPAQDAATGCKEVIRTALAADHALKARNEAILKSK
jgi:hypothetical protein